MQVFFPLWGSEIRLQVSKTMIYGCGLWTRCLELKKKKVLHFMVFPDKLQKEVILIQCNVFWWSVAGTNFISRLCSRSLNRVLKITKIHFLFVCLLLFLRLQPWDETIYRRMCFLALLPRYSKLCSQILWSSVNVKYISLIYSFCGRIWKK